MLGGSREDLEDSLPARVVRRVGRDHVERLAVHRSVERSHPYFGVLHPVAAQVQPREADRSPVHFRQDDRTIGDGSGRRDTHGAPTASQVKDAVGPVEGQVLDQERGPGVEAMRGEDAPVDKEVQHLAPV